MTEQKLSDLSRQAYLDSLNSRKMNVEKFSHKSDPILQNNEYYVRTIN